MQNEIKNIFRQKNNFDSSKDNEEKLYMLKLKNMYLLRDNESGIVYTNNRILDSEIRRFKDIGITNEKREKELIVSLTSFPQRMKDIKYALYSLLTQTLKPNKIILWLAESQFPNGEKDIPQDVLNLKDNGLSIQFYREDIKSYKKLIPALEQYPNDIIVTADDDVFYLRDWLERLYNNYLKNRCIVCCRGYKMDTTKDNRINRDYFSFKYQTENGEKAKFILSLCGGGGLYQPNYFYKDILNKDLFMKLCPTSDDIWFSIQNVLQNNCTVVTGLPENPFGYKHFISTNLLRDKNQTDEFRLTKINSVFGNKNNENLNNVLNYYKDELEEIYKKLDNSN